MSYTNGFQTLVQSMNGLLTFNDGAGTVIENGNITTKSLTLDNIYATTLSSTVRLWDNLTSGYVFLFSNMETGIINIGSILSAGFITIGTTMTYITLGIFKFEYNSIQLLPGYSSIVNLFTDFTIGTINFATGLTDGDIDIGTSIESGNINIGSKSNIFINNSATTESTLISINTSATGLVAIGSSVNRNVLGAVEVTGSQINSQVKTQDLRIGKLLTTGMVDIGSSIISVIVGSFTFLGNSIQAGTSGTINLFTNLTGTSTINLGTNITTGTLNIGKGGNINLGQATTGSLIKIDQNGLDTQVIISPQQGSTGVVSIGNNSNQNNVGNLRIVDKSINAITAGSINIGTSNTPLVNIGGNGNVILAINPNSTILSYLEVASTAPTCKLDFHCGGSGSNVDYDARIIATATNSTTNGTAIIETISATIREVGNTFLSYLHLGQTYPGYVNVNCGVNTTDINLVSATNSLPNAYDTQIRSNNSGIWGANGGGLLQFFSGQQEMLYSASFVPRNLITYLGGAMGYYDGGGTTENAFTISGYAPYGAVRFGGCGSSNAKGFSTSWGQSMAIYPGYGTRLFNGGISFDKGSLSPGSGAERGWVPQCGVYPLNNTTIGANSNTTVAMTFGYTFSANPYITVTMISELAGGNVDGLIPTVYSLSTTGFSVVIKNTQGSTSGNRWGFHYIAWGAY